MAAQTPEVLADPLRVVIDLVAGIESSLGRARIEAVVVDVAGGRAKRRRLAQALQERPSLLADGRSPAPAVVGNLLIALRNAGACDIAVPVCADCGKAQNFCYVHMHLPWGHRISRRRRAVSRIAATQSGGG